MALLPFVHKSTLRLVYLIRPHVDPAMTTAVILLVTEIGASIGGSVGESKTALLNFLFLM